MELDRRKRRQRHQWNCHTPWQVAVALRLGRDVVVKAGPDRTPEEAKTILVEGIKLARRNAGFTVGEHGAVALRPRK